MPRAPIRGDGADIEPSVISRRPLLRALLTAPALIALGSGCSTASSSPSSDSDESTGPYELPSAAAAVAEKRKKPVDFGLAYSDTLPWMTDADLGQALDDAVDLGITWIRADLAWTNIQPDGESQYLWERFDRVARAAQKRDLKVLATLGYTPKWSRDLSCASEGATCPPASNARFAQFVSEAVARYAAMGVHTWQIWNEPNISGFWAGGADPERYAEMVKETSKAIRAADPDSFVLMAGLANAATTNSKRQTPADFLDNALKLGVGDHVDGISFHAFSHGMLLSTKTGDSPYEHVTGVRRSLTAVLAQHERTDLEIWLTETGAPTHGKGAIADREQPGVETSHVTPAHQARIATDMVKAADELTAVTKVFWYAHRDVKSPEANAGTWAYYGLIDYAGERKPAFDAYRDAVVAYRAKN
ncbi:cellulase family glycosylhydrolase [Streptomyces sp. NPDC096132]|uniref:cellulase family glycosylhydrolase n=1 Tax=Streptomyces sp. NPDC096132 TaxID=3366075 RepID=UPI00383063FD